MGGVNLLDQAEEQERLLEKSAREFEKRQKKETKLREQLQRKEAEKLDIEEKYDSLKEEATGKTKLLKLAWKKLQQAKDEVQYVYWRCLRTHNLILECPLSKLIHALGSSPF